MYQTSVLQNKCLGKKITLKNLTIQVAKELGMEIYAVIQAQKVHTGHPVALVWTPGDQVP